MLVLSRKSSQELNFPSLGITVRVLRTSANGVKLGIIAPKHVKVIRGELRTIEEYIQDVCEIKDHVQAHEIRNRLNSLVLNLELLKRLEHNGISNEDMSCVNEVAKALKDLDHVFGQVVSRSNSSSPQVGNTRLMVVDDNVNERELLCSVLALHGFQVQSAADGIEAIEKLDGQHVLPHAVLLDLHMPRLNGETTLRCIRTDYRYSKLKIIGISGNQPDLSLIPDDLPGFDAWFAKPLQLDRLISLIHEPGFVVN